MLKIIYAFIVSILVGLVTLAFSIILSIKTINSIFIGLLISNVILVGMYIPDMINNTMENDLIYIIAYTVICFIFYLFYIPYILIINNCYFRLKCCNRDNYLEMDN